MTKENLAAEVIFLNPEISLKEFVLVELQRNFPQGTTLRLARQFLGRKFHFTRDQSRFFLFELAKDRSISFSKDKILFLECV